MREALILFAHGARDPRWAEPFVAVAERVRLLRPGIELRLAFLEFMSPTLPEAGDALAAAGCTRIVVQPLFLGTGGHVRKDLPLLIDGLRQRHPGTVFTLETAIGELPAVMDAMATAVAAVLDSR